MAWTVDDIPDQSGRIAIVTGANSGIGLETALALAVKGAHVILACRNEEKGANALHHIREHNPSGDTELMRLDLSDLSSVREFADAYTQKFDALDLIINNAGVMVPPYSKTADGFELQFGTNHLGHFALTGLLLDVLHKTPNSRIVNVSSLAHRQGKMNWDDLHWEQGYKPWPAYGQSKLANLLFTYELQRRLEQGDTQTIASASHPGWTETNLQVNSPLAKFFNPFLAQSQPMGALPTLYAATASDVRGGDYFGPAGFMEMRGTPKRVDSNARSHDTASAKTLWSISEELTGVNVLSPA